MKLRPLTKVVATCISITYKCDTGVMLDAVSPLLTRAARRTTLTRAKCRKGARPLYGCFFVDTSAMMVATVIC